MYTHMILTGNFNKVEVRNKTRFGTKLPDSSHNWPVNLVCPRYIIMVLAAAVNMGYTRFWVKYSTKWSGTRCLTLPGTERKVGGCSILRDINRKFNKAVFSRTLSCTFATNRMTTCSEVSQLLPAWKLQQIKSWILVTACIVYQTCQLSVGWVSRLCYQ